MSKLETPREAASFNLHRPILTYLGFVIVAWLVNYPGRLNPDSYNMLFQAQYIETVNDWHSPAVTWLWSLFTPVLGQPAGALFAQSLLIFAYPVLSLTKRRHPTGRLSITRGMFLVGYGAFLAALIPLTGNISKDQVLVGLILCLLWLVYLKSEFYSTAPLGYWLWYFPFVGMILLVRPTNFLMLAVAGVILGSFIFEPRKYMIVVMSILVGCLVAVPATSLVNRIVFGAKNALTERSLIIFDIAGISTRAKIDLFTELPGWPTDRILRPWECYTPALWDPFAWVGRCKEYSDLISDRIQQSGITVVIGWWMGTILRHPLSYIKHRLSYMANLIGNHTRVFETYALNSPNSDVSGVETYGIDMRRSLQVWEPTIRYRPFKMMADLVFSRLFVVVGLLANVGALIWSWREMFSNSTKVDIVVVVSSAIGVGNLVMLVPFGVADAGRYLLPSVICGIVSLLRVIQYKLT